MLQRGCDLLGSDSSGREILKPRSAACRSPCLPKPKPPNLAPGWTFADGKSGVSECWLVERERGGCEPEADRSEVVDGAW